MKDVNALYSILSDVLDCDYRRLIDAIDGVDDDVLSYAIIEARDNENLSLDGIMQEVINGSFEKCDYTFYKECDRVLPELDKDSDAFQVLDALDVSSIRDSICYEDGLCWSEENSEYSEEEMVVLLTYLKTSFKKLETLMGVIDGLPDIKKEEE